MSANKFLRMFTEEVEEETVTIPLHEYEDLKMKVEYFCNKVRQYEHRPYLVPRGKGPDGEITWGTPANGIDQVPYAEG